MRHKLYILPLAALLLAPLSFGQGLDTTASKDDWEEINFEFNSAVLTDGFPSLLRLAELLRNNAGYRVRLDGHADYIGSDRYNERLSQRRAEAVKAFLVKYGARDNQVELVPRGERQPKVNRQTREARFMNRRVAVAALDASGQVISATGTGIGDAIKAIQETCADCKKIQAGLDDVLRKLDRLEEIAKLLKGMQSEHDQLRKDVAALQQGQQATTKQIAELPKPLSSSETEKLTRDVVTDEIARNNLPRFSILGANVGADSNRDITFSGRGRFFAPFREKFAFQAQGEYMYWKDRQEGQLDFGLVSRFARRGQAGVFSSFKHVNMRSMQSGGTLGQAALTLDYIFNRGRVGFYGTKGFLQEATVNRANISRNILEETYLRIVDQAGASASVGLWGNAMMEANAGWIAMRGGSDKPGGTIRLIQPLTNRMAFTVEGGWNETLVGRDNYGRVVAGLLFGNFLSPKEYLASDHPIPVDIPRVRYEMLTRRTRTGNDAPIADAGPDQIGVAAGEVVLDGSASYDPDGDPITYQWDQVAGPTVSLSGRNTSRATFTSAEGQSYSFRLTVRDSNNAQSLARVSVTTREAPRVQIQQFTATPSSIRAGASSVLSWQVQNANEVEISGIGRVDARAGTATVSPQETTIYRLTARNAQGEQVSTTQVTVERPTVRIIGFRSAPSEIEPGQASNLVWETENADTVEISGIGPVQANGTLMVTPSETTTYTITARNRFGQVSTTASVTVRPRATTPPATDPPTIQSFTANPATINQGQSSQLCWVVQGATEVTISGLGNQTLNACTNVNPSTTTTYTLIARNTGGDRSSSVTVTVNPAPPAPQARIVSFTASPTTTPSPGSVARLTWVTENATTVSISGIGAVAASGSIDVTPATNTTYILTAGNAQNTVTQSVTINVTPLPPNNPPTVSFSHPDVIEAYTRWIILDASPSTDPDGNPLTFQWRMIRGAGNNFSSTSIVYDRSANTPVYLYGIPGDYVFEVVVTDSRGATASKQVTVKLIPNRLP